ncbi:phage tail assembly chaperone family protein, TAC [Edwardsiella tarda]|uniref:phage tail assembly chaperone family protein, TAC n=1 Tax=Edwardsiella tarda TaxID=636 RepID=UPI00083B263E|nr:phage tail assembly chaperone family protein, TAC [Edwardsiella tarda]
MNRESFLQFAIKPKKITVSHFNDVEIYVKPLSYSTATAIGEIEDTVERCVHILIASVCDEHGVALFTNSEEDIELISSQFTYYAIVEIAGKVSEMTSNTDSQLVK